MENFQKHIVAFLGRILTWSSDKNQPNSWLRYTTRACLYLGIGFAMSPLVGLLPEPVQILVFIVLGFVTFMVYQANEKDKKSSSEVVLSYKVFMIWGIAIQGFMDTPQFSLFVAFLFAIALVFKVDYIPQKASLDEEDGDISEAEDKTSSE